MRRLFSPLMQSFSAALTGAIFAGAALMGSAFAQTRPTGPNPSLLGPVTCQFAIVNGRTDVRGCRGTLELIGPTAVGADFAAFRGMSGPIEPPPTGSYLELRLSSLASVQPDGGLTMRCTLIPVDGVWQGFVAHGLFAWRSLGYGSSILSPGSSEYVLATPETVETPSGQQIQQVYRLPRDARTGDIYLRIFTLANDNSFQFRGCTVTGRRIAMTAR